MLKSKCEYMLANDHASVALASVVYDPNENNLLVAAFTVATSVERLPPHLANLASLCVVLDMDKVLEGLNKVSHCYLFLAFCISTRFLRAGS